MTSSYQFQKGNDYCHILSVCDEQEVQHTVVDSAFVPWKEQVHYIPHFVLHPTSNHSSLHPWSLKCGTQSTTTSVSGDWIISLSVPEVAYLVCSSIVVSTSSWSDARVWIFTQLPSVMSTHVSPSLLKTYTKHSHICLHIYCP